MMTFSVLFLMMLFLMGQVVQGQTDITVMVPTQTPAEAPTVVPSQVPIETPSEVPTQSPTQAPTQVPSPNPTQVPTDAPPSQLPTQIPTAAPITVLYTVQYAFSSLSQGNGIAVDSQNEAVYVVGDVYGDSDSMVKVFGARYNDSSEGMVYGVVDGLLGQGGSANAVVLNGSESIYMVGNTGGSSAAKKLAFLKFATNGTLLFAKYVENNNDHVIGNALAIDKENNIIITGSIDGDFQGLTNAGDEDIIVVKYSASGDLIYVKLYGTSSNDEAYGIGIDSLNNIYLTGYTTGSLNGQAYNGEYAQAFLMKLNSTGSVLYTRLFGTAGTNQGNALVLDRDDNVYITGNMRNMYPTYATTDIFLSKYDSVGNHSYTTLSGGSDYDVGNAIAIDDDNGFIYIVGGTYSSSLDNNANHGGTDIFFRKYSINGERVYTALYGTENDDEGLGVFVDDARNIFITGLVRGSLNGQPFEGGLNAFYMKIAGPTPTSVPTAVPTQAPSEAPTEVPSQVPTQSPSEAPTEVPSQVPTQSPSEAPTEVPSQAPTQAPSEAPTEVPSQVPTQSPSEAPTEVPSQAPTQAPSEAPTEVPSQVPTQSPSEAPTEVPSQVPTQSPSEAPTEVPTQAPTIIPTVSPSHKPSLTPTLAPSGVTASPTLQSETILLINSFYQLTRNVNSDAALEDADIRAVRQAVAKEGRVDVRYTKYVDSTEMSPSSSLVIPGMVADSMEVGESEEESGARVNARRRGVRGVLKGLERDDVVTSSFLRGEDVLPAREEIQRQNQYQHPDLHLTSPKTYVLQVDLELPLVDFPVYQGNAAALYVNLTQTLLRSVSSGSFLERLLSEAAEQRATVITVESVAGVHKVTFSAPLFAFPPTLAPSQHPRHDDDSWLGDGAVVGLVIGPILGLLLLMMLVYGSIVRMRELRK